jgi:hypothetical protein
MKTGREQTSEVVSSEENIQRKGVKGEAESGVGSAPLCQTYASETSHLLTVLPSRSSPQNCGKVKGVGLAYKHLTRERRTNAQYLSPLRFPSIAT